MAEVRLENVQKIYDGGVRAVDNFNLVIPDREFCVFVGPSGCGKSTTLRMIAGLEEISTGSIHIDDRKVNDVAPKDRDIGMVFQNYALYPHKTVYKNMSFPLEMRRFKKSEIDERVREAADILGITELLERKPKALSGGQRQRVAVGRAIVRKPKVFLFDEPLSNLDAKMRVQMRVEISKLHTRLQTTMIYVTHDQTEAMTMGDRIVVMKDGKALQVDDPLSLYNAPKNKFVAGFIGSPAMNFMNGKLESKDDGVWFDEGSFRLRLNDKQSEAARERIGAEVVFGVRPEDLYVLDGAEHLAERPGSRLEADVEVVEPMGAETYVYLRTDASNFIARLAAGVSPAYDERLPLAVDIDKAHLFDRATETCVA